MDHFKLFLFFLLLFISAIFSSTESAFFSLGRFKIRRLSKISEKKYQKAKKLLDRPTELISTFLIGNEITNIAIGVLGASLVYDWFNSSIKNDTKLSLVTVLLILPFIIVFGEIIPKTLGLKYSEKVALANTPFLDAFSRVVYPIRKALAWIPDKILKFFHLEKTKNEKITEEMFRTMVDVGWQEGVIDSQEKNLIHNVFRLDDVTVINIMTRLDQVSCVYPDMTIEETLKHVHKEKFSRYPVLNRQRSEVLGVLYAKDLIHQSMLNKSHNIEPFLRKPLVVNAKTNALELFSKFKTRKMHFAAVIDEESKTIIGVVTLEDVLEEIFGSIEDERDIEDGQR